MRRQALVARVVVAAMLAAPAVHARQEQMSGKKLSMRRGRTTIQARGYFDAPAPGSAGDPSVVGATLKMKVPYDDKQVDLPAAGWRKSGTGWTFTGALVPGSLVRKALLRKGSMKVIAIGKESYQTPDDAAIPLPSHGGVGMAKIALKTGDAEYCVDYGGPQDASGVTRDVLGQRFDARNSATTSWCTGCGNGTVSATEECDDGNHDNGDGCSANCVVEQEPGACVPVTTSEVRDNARDDPAYRTLLPKIAAMGFDMSRMIFPMKCGMGGAPFYVGGFANLTPGGQPMLLLSQRGLFDDGSTRTFAAYTPTQDDTYLILGERRFHIVKTSATTGRLDTLDAAGNVIDSGPIPAPESGAVSAAIQTWTQSGKLCQAREDAESDCFNQNVLQVFKILAVPVAFWACAVKAATGDITPCIGIPLTLWGAFTGQGFCHDRGRDLDGDGEQDWWDRDTCFVDDPDANLCYTGYCQRTRVNGSPTGPMQCVPGAWAEQNYWVPDNWSTYDNAGVKTSCDADCFETCHDGRCEGFKVDVAGDGSAGYVGLSSTGFSSTPCTSGTGGWEGGPNYATSISFCGTPVPPVTVTVGGNTATFTQQNYGAWWEPVYWFKYFDGWGYFSMHTCCSGMLFCCSIDPIVPMAFSAVDAGGNSQAYPAAVVWCD